jgi:hypothetical protein
MLDRREIREYFCAAARYYGCTRKKNTTGIAAEAAQYGFYAGSACLLDETLTLKVGSLRHELADRMQAPAAAAGAISFSFSPTSTRSSMTARQTPRTSARVALATWFDLP